jgi:hypothetical protein
MIGLFAAWFPKREIVLSGDSAYGGRADDVPVPGLRLLRVSARAVQKSTPIRIASPAVRSGEAPRPGHWQSRVPAPNVKESILRYPPSG